MNETCPDKKALLLYAEGELSGGEADELSGHIERCRDCRDAVSGLRALAAALRRARAGIHAGAGSLPRPPSGRDCPDGERLAAYADGSLDRDAAAEVEAHLGSCGPCLSEVADLWSMSGPPDRDAPESAVAAVLTRLGNDSRTAVLRWATRSVELVRDFASGLTDTAGGPAPAPALAAALSRSGVHEVRMHWSDGDAVLEAIARAEEDGVSLTGRVTVGGTPAASTSAALASSATSRGPESLDVDGRFGPWPLSPGENKLRLTGLPSVAGGAAELVVRLNDAEDDEI